MWYPWSGICYNQIQSLLKNSIIGYLKAISQLGHSRSLLFCIDFNIEEIVIKMLFVMNSYNMDFSLFR